MLINADLGSEDHYEAARKEGLGVFVRTLIGLDRSAAMREFGEFLQKYELNARQQEFVAMVIEELTRIGILEHSRLFYDPFTGLAPAGVQSLFNEDQTTDLYRVLKRIKEQVLEPAGV